MGPVVRRTLQKYIEKIYIHMYMKTDIYIYTHTHIYIHIMQIFITCIIHSPDIKHSPNNKNYLAPNPVSQNASVKGASTSLKGANTSIKEAPIGVETGGQKGADWTKPPHSVCSLLRPQSGAVGAEPAPLIMKTGSRLCQRSFSLGGKVY